MSVAATYKSGVVVKETLTASVAGADSPIITHDVYDSEITLNAGSTPPATDAVFWQQDLAAGTATIDLTSLTGTNGESIDGTGKRVQVLKFKALAANANTIAVIPAAANGYELSGADFKITLSPGQEFLYYGNEATPEIGAAAKDFTLTGTGTQGLEVSIVLG